jgi:sodium-dependent dicarboxylate transporter 2/3/5
VTSGVSDVLAARLTALGALPPLLGLAAVAAVTLAVGAVASNTATAALLIPLAIPLAGMTGADPVVLVVVVAIASSIDFALVVGTPPTMIAYSSGLFRVAEIFRVGIVLDLIGLVLLVTLVVGAWRLLGVV